MEKTNLLTLVVTLTVGIILAGSLLMPVITDATTTDKTFTNEGYLRFTEIDATETAHVEWAVATFDTVTVDGEDYQIYTSNNPNRIDNVSLFMIPDVGILRYNTGSSGFVANQLVGLGALSIGVAFDIVLEEGTYTITNDQNQSVTGSYTTAYIIHPEGEFVLKNKTSNAYVLEDSTVFGMGITNVLVWNNGFQIEGDNFQVGGDVDNIEVSTFNEGTSTFAISNIADDLSAVDGYLNLFQLGKVTFTVTGTPTEGDPATVNATYNYFLVPYQVTAELATHLNPGEIALMNALPVIVIIGLVLAGVGAIFVRNHD